MKMMAFLLKFDWKFPIKCVPKGPIHKKSSLVLHLAHWGITWTNDDPGGVSKTRMSS